MRACYYIQKDSGFSLVELMISVVIISVLATLGVTTFRTFAMKAKASEAARNLSLIRRMEECYKVENDMYLACPANPIAWASGPGASTPRAWDILPNPNPWEQIGFAPDGAIRYQYAVVIGGPNAYTATATGDVDEDAQPAIFTLSNDAANQPAAAAQYPAPLKVGDNY